MNKKSIQKPEDFHNLKLQKIKYSPCSCGNNDYVVEEQHANFNNGNEHPNLSVLSCRNCNLKRSFPSPQNFSTFNEYDKVGDQKQDYKDTSYDTFAEELRAG